MKHAPRITFAILASLGLSACVEVEQNVILLPDGSGKLEFKVSVKTDQPGAGNFDDAANPDELEKNVKGIVAWAQPVEEEKDGWKRIRLVGYFDDINKVKFIEPPAEEGAETKEMLSFEMKKTDKGFELVTKDQMSDQMSKDLGGAGGAGDDEFAKQMKEMMKQMMKSFKISFVANIPGKIVESKGYTSTEGRKAVLNIDGQLLTDVIDGKEEAKKKLESIKGERRVSWGASELPEAEAAAFKKELESARQAWPRIREDLKKRAEERKKNPPGEENPDPDKPMDRDR